MKTILHEGEQIMKSSSANLQKGMETVGGKLYLTDRRLVFESHRCNVQTGGTVIERSDIQSLKKCWTKFLGLIPLVPNSLAVHTKQGKEYRFVLFDRGVWLESIGIKKSA